MLRALHMCAAPTTLTATNRIESAFCEIYRTGYRLEIRSGWGHDRIDGQRWRYQVHNEVNRDSLTNTTDNKGNSTDYEYDILGTRTKSTLQKGTPDEHITSYGYDTANRPQTITSKTGTFTYGYDSKSRRQSTTYPHGIATTYQYDTVNRLTSIKHNNGTNTIAFANYSSFDKVGNRKDKITPTGTENFNYDATYRLTQAATPKGTENYSYDQVGNRQTGPGPKDTKYQYNPGNQAIKGKIFGHDYDSNGNQTSRTTTSTEKSWIYTWDYENRLIKSEQTKGAEKRTVSFKYDPLGRRIEKQLVTIIKGITKTSTWQYVYDGDNIAIEIYTNEAGATEKTWYTHGSSVDEHLALERNGSNYFYHADGLGSVTTITDSSKAVVQSYSYDSFGLVKPSTAFRNSFTYTGREWDKETGLYYYRARYYDPMEGRFIQKDPIGFKGGDVNLYGYVRNNAINRVDPSGLRDITILDWFDPLQTPFQIHSFKDDMVRAFNQEYFKTGIKCWKELANNYSYFQATIDSFKYDTSEALDHYKEKCTPCNEFEKYYFLK